MANPRPTILDVAARAVGPRLEAPSPRWTATLAYAYGEPLTNEQVTELVAATGRSREGIIAHARQTVGRRRFRQIWARIGRRGRKSAIAALIAVYEALYGGHEAHLMAGEQGLVAVISKDLAGATVVTRFVRAYLTALRVRFTSSRMGAVSVIEIDGSQIGIATLACTADAPRGFAIPVVILDEFAHVATEDGYENSDKDILAGVEPAMLQFSDPLIVGISTGLGTTGVHYDRVERGLGNDAEHDILSVTGASWEWNPRVTREAALAACEGEPDLFHREYEGGVVDREGLAWTPAFTRRAFVDHPGEYIPQGPAFMALDPASTTNTFAWLVGRWWHPSGRASYARLSPPSGHGLSPDIFVGDALDEHGHPIPLPRPKGALLAITEIGGIPGDEIERLTMLGVCRTVAEIAKSAGVAQIFSDAHGAGFLPGYFSPEVLGYDPGFTIRTLKPTNAQIHESVRLIEMLLRDDHVWIQPHAGIERDMLTYPRTISGGLFKYGKGRGRGPHHWDWASCLVLLGHAHLLDKYGQADDSDHHIEGSPARRFLGRRTEIPA